MLLVKRQFVRCGVVLGYLLCLLLASGCVASQESLLPRESSLPQTPLSAPTPTLVPGESIHFEVIAQDVGGCEEPYKPVALFATTVDEFARMWSLQISDPARKPPTVDFNHVGVMLVTNICDDSFYSIEVRNIVRLQDGSLTVYVEAPHQKWEEGANAAVIAWNQFVTLSQDAVPSAETDVSLVVYVIYRQ